MGFKDLYIPTKNLDPFCEIQFEMMREREREREREKWFLSIWVLVKIESLKSDTKLYIEC
ncbi:hypothetical protein HanIR_Chr06g0258831 [Helianthus annuus]|nr:hypothetical protein HanIR_Chr06g0258831 [Helianthus annuus]